MSKNHWDTSGSNNPSWLGGKSFEPYGLKFNKSLKEEIRKRDNYRCQECFRYQNELFKNTKAGWRPYALYIHHIDYNKRDNIPNNLISLCLPCHSQTNSSRENWTEYFKNKILKKWEYVEGIHPKILEPEVMFSGATLMI